MKIIKLIALTVLLFATWQIVRLCLWAINQPNDAMFFFGALIGASSLVGCWFLSEKIWKFKKKEGMKE